MRRRGGQASIVASPVLVGAVTVLIAIVAVFLAYNANQGLPFVPTYDLKALVPSGAKLVEGNEVRLGGRRVGQVGAISTRTVERDGEPLTVAELELKLESAVDPLPADSVIAVRPRSALGLKYVELVPGTGDEMLEPGDTLPLDQARAQVDLEDVLSTFEPETRHAIQTATAGYGNAFAGRGADLNTTIREFAPLLQHLTPVMRVLSAERTRLDQFFLQIGRAAAQAAPVARQQAELFGLMADTFAAIGRNPTALRETIDRSPETLQAGIESFRVQRPFLRDFTELSRLLEPATAALPGALPQFNRALRRGAPVLRDTPALNRQATDVFVALEDLTANPNTLLALRDLDRTVELTGPLIRFLAPYQLVCNYFNYFWGPLGTHQSYAVRNGTIEGVQLVLTNEFQDDRLGTSEADRPADVPADQDPQTATDEEGNPLTKLNTQFYGPAVDAQGRADCQAGQTGYPDGPLVTGGRYPPDTAEGGFRNGGSHIVVDPDTPGRAGGTYWSREAGVDELGDIE